MDIKQKLKDIRRDSTDLAATNARLDGLLREIENEEAVQRKQDEAAKTAKAEGSGSPAQTPTKPPVTTTHVQPLKP